MDPSEQVKVTKAERLRVIKVARGACRAHRPLAMKEKA